MFYKLQREPLRWQRLFIYLPSKQVNEPGIVAEGRGMHINIDTHFGRQACGPIANGGQATLINGRFRPLAPDIIEQNIRPFKICSLRSANQCLDTIDASRFALDLKNRLKANGQLMGIKNGFENGLLHAVAPANSTTVFPNSFNRSGFRRNTSAPAADASALSSGQP